jgi:glycine/D-amino acid oxidase-like deaminating enzyme
MTIFDVVILGAGLIGVSAALHLRQRARRSSSWSGGHAARRRAE